MNQPDKSTLVLKELIKTNPLDDRAFQILLNNNDTFFQIVQIITGRPVPNAVVIDFPQVLVAVVEGREIRLDTVRQIGGEVYNLEGQNKASDFTFKRHLFHWANTFSQTIQKSGKFEDAMPVITIVLYKDNSDEPVFQDCCLSGTLVKTDTKMLDLIALNAKKWKDAESEELKIFLSIVSNGVYTEENKCSFEGVNTESPLFKKLNRDIRLSCSYYRLEEAEEKGDTEMVKLYKDFISEEDREKNRAEGRAEGEKRGKIETLYTVVKWTVEQIASHLKIDETEVKKTLQELKLI